MTIYIPSFHKPDRKISELLNRPESVFVIRPEQEDFYKQNFPLARIEPRQTDPPGLNCLIKARNWILNDWRTNAPDNEIFAWMLDDDWTGFTLNLADGSPRTNPTLEEAYEFLVSKADEKTRIIGPTNSNSEMAFNPEEIRTNKGESPESVYLISKFCTGNYEEGTFENQQISAEQIISGGNFKCVQALQLNYINDAAVSTLFNTPDYILFTKQMCENTVKKYPNWMFEMKIGKQGTWKLKFKGKDEMASLGFKFGG
jgi:hypothetical protein